MDSKSRDQAEINLDQGKIKGDAPEPYSATKTTDMAKYILEDNWRGVVRWKWIALGAVASCVAYGMLILGIAWFWSGKSLADLGTVGDSFGALNTLFSALALFGVIVTIAMQSRELELQREELKQLTLESRRTADAQEEIQKVQVAELQRANDIASDKAQPIFELRRCRYYGNGSEINQADCDKGSYNPGKNSCFFEVKLRIRNLGEPVSDLEVRSDDWVDCLCLDENDTDYLGTLNPGEAFVLHLKLMMDSRATRFTDKLFRLSYLNRHRDRYLMMGYITESKYGTGVNWVGTPICIARVYGADVD